MDKLMTIELSPHHQIQGTHVWGPNKANKACVRLEDGTTRQGDYIDPETSLPVKEASE